MKNEARVVIEEAKTGLPKSSENVKGMTMKKKTQLEENQMRQTLVDSLCEAAKEAFWAKDPESRRKGWTTVLEMTMPPELKTDPYVLGDMVETNVMLGDAWYGFLIEFGDKEYEAETVFEAEFLSFLTLALKRGMPFQEAWERAIGLMLDLNEVTRIVYELKPELDDDYELGLWTERLVGLGVELNEATELAREITVLLRQIWLTRDADFYEEDMLTESDQEDRNSLLEKLSSMDLG